MASIEQLGSREEINEGVRGVILRELVPDDAFRIRELVEYDPEHLRSVGEDGVVAMARGRDLRRSIAANQKSRGTGWHPEFDFGIWRQPEPMFGELGYRVVGPGVAEVWFWIGAQHVRQGLGSAALRTITTHLFRVGYTRIRGKVRRDNIASQNTFLSADYRAVGSAYDNDYLVYGRRSESPSPSASGEVRILEDTRV